MSELTIPTELQNKIIVAAQNVIISDPVKGQEILTTLREDFTVDKLEDFINDLEKYKVDASPLRGLLDLLPSTKVRGYVSDSRYIFNADLYNLALSMIKGKEGMILYINRAMSIDESLVYSKEVLINEKKLVLLLTNNITLQGKVVAEEWLGTKTFPVLTAYQQVDRESNQVTRMVHFYANRGIDPRGWTKTQELKEEYYGYRFYDELRDKEYLILSDQKFEDPNAIDIVEGMCVTKAEEVKLKDIKLSGYSSIVHLTQARSAPFGYEIVSRILQEKFSEANSHINQKNALILTPKNSFDNSQNQSQKAVESEGSQDDTRYANGEGGSSQTDIGCEVGYFFTKVKKGRSPWEGTLVVPNFEKKSEGEKIGVLQCSTQNPGGQGKDEPDVPNGSEQKIGQKEGQREALFSDVRVAQENDLSLTPPTFTSQTPKQGQDEALVKGLSLTPPIPSNTASDPRVMQQETNTTQPLQTHSNLQEKEEKEDNCDLCVCGVCVTCVSRAQAGAVGGVVGGIPIRVAPSGFSLNYHFCVSGGPRVMVINNFKQLIHIGFFNKYRHPMWFEELIIAWVLSGKMDDPAYPLHLFLFQKGSGGKSTLQRRVGGFLGIEEIDIWKGDSSTVTSLIPNFGQTPPDVGWLAKQKHFGFLDEFFGRHRSKDGENYLSAYESMKSLLTHSKTKGSSGKGEVTANATAKFMFSSNFKYGITDLETFMRKTDPALVERVLVYNFSEEHYRFVEGRREEVKDTTTYPSYMPDEFYRHLILWSQKFNVKGISPKRLREIRKSLIKTGYGGEKEQAKVEYVDARLNHHIECIIDGLVKLRYFSEGRFMEDMHVKEEDYQKAQMIIEIVSSTWINEFDIKHFTKEARMHMLTPTAKTTIDFVKESGGKCMESDLIHYAVDVCQFEPERVKASLDTMRAWQLISLHNGYFLYYEHPEFKVEEGTPQPKVEKIITQPQSERMTAVIEDNKKKRDEHDALFDHIKANEFCTMEELKGAGFKDVEDKLMALVMRGVVYEPRSKHYKVIE